MGLGGSIAGLLFVPVANAQVPAATITAVVASGISDLTGYITDNVSTIVLFSFSILGLFVVIGWVRRAFRGR